MIKLIYLVLKIEITSIILMEGLQMSENALTVQQNEIKTLIEGIKAKKIYFSDVPEELRLHPLIVATEKECGIRKSTKQGYDIINKNFFVEETVLLGKDWEKTITNSFSHICHKRIGVLTMCKSKILCM